MSSDTDDSARPSYQSEADRLQQLPRAERFQALVTFPDDFRFKAIGRGEAFVEAVRRLVAELGHPQAPVSERPSSGGKYVAVGFVVRVHSGLEVDRIYRGLEALPDLLYVL